MTKAIAVIILCAVCAGVVRYLFPIRVTQNIPVIETVWDTVTQLDTIERTRTIKEIIREAGEVHNLVETVTVTRVDTVTLYREAICPQLLQVGEKFGSNTTIEGFTLIQDSLNNLLKRDFKEVIYTTGPLRALAVDSVLPIKVVFGQYPKPCGLLCKLGFLGAGVAGGYAACKL